MESSLSRAARQQDLSDNHQILQQDIIKDSIKTGLHQDSVPSDNTTPSSPARNHSEPDWVTQNKRSPRPHHEAHERESKTHRKGSPQKSPHTNASNRYSVLLEDNGPTSEPMECDGTLEKQPDVYDLTSEADMEQAVDTGYDTDPTNNLSSSKITVRGSPLVLTNIPEQDVSSSKPRWGDEDDISDEDSMSCTSKQELGNFDAGEISDSFITTQAPSHATPNDHTATPTSHTSHQEFPPFPHPARSQYTPPHPGRGGDST